VVDASLKGFVSILCLLFPLALTGAQAPMITSPVDNSVRVRIANSTHPKANSIYDAGRLDGGVALERMILVLGSSAEQEHGARTFLDSQQTKSSPDFHRWITPEEFGQKFGPATQDIQQVKAWLQQQGFAVTSVAKSGRWIEFSGTSSQVEAAFQTEMRHYQVDGELHTANATDITIPVALSSVVRGAASLHDFYSKPTVRSFSTKAMARSVGGKPMIDLGTLGHALTPGDFAAIYNLNPLYNGVAPSPQTTPLDGSGQTIAIVAESLINTQAGTGIDDVAIFRQIFGLPANAPNIIVTGDAPAFNGAGFEATLDVEWAGAVAPKAQIDLVASAGTLTTDPVILSSIYVVDNNLAPIMNLSFSGCEAAMGSAENAFWNGLWEQAAAQGISVFVASGDNGAADCESSYWDAPSELAVNGLSSTPFNTSVGGTEFNETVDGGTATTFWNSGTVMPAAIGYIPETVWNDCLTKCGDAAGGGISSIYAVPSWQTLSITGLSGAGYTMRALPDVSLSAAEGHDPYVVCYSRYSFEPDCQVSGGVVSFSQFGGGTSFSSPAMAGVMALINQAAGGRQGLANYELYSLAAAENSSYSACNSSSQTNPATRASQCAFNDVTTGDNGVPGADTLVSFVPPGDVAGQLGYSALAGYDPATGLGSINAAALVNAWTKDVAEFKGSATTLSASFNGTSLPSSSVSIVHGQPVSINVSVQALGTDKSHTPGKEISLLAKGGNLSSDVGFYAMPLTGGNGTANSGYIDVKYLPAGTNYDLYAYYPGDGVFAGSTSNSISVSVAPENTTSIVQSGILTGGVGSTPTSGSSLDYGDINMLAFTVNVAGVSQLLPTKGSVAFTDNGTPLGAVALGPEPAGTAQYIDGYTVRNRLSIGQHVIVATYGGDGVVPSNYNGSTSNGVTVTITKGVPTLVSVRSPQTAVAGQQVNLNTYLIFGEGAIVPTGTVQFMDGSTTLGAPVTLDSNANAAITVTLNTTGTHSLTAQYSGDSLYNSVTSDASTLQITAPFTLASTITSQTIQQGQAATFNLTLSNSNFVGVIALTCTSTNAPAGVLCSIPSSETLTASTTSIPITMTVTTATKQSRVSPVLLRTLPFSYAAFAGVVFFVNRKTMRIALVALVLLVALGMSACGGSKTANTQPSPYATFVVTGTSGTMSTSVMVNVVINQ
jgi:hypothetical protein